VISARVVVASSSLAGAPSCRFRDGLFRPITSPAFPPPRLRQRQANGYVAGIHDGVPSLGLGASEPAQVAAQCTVRPCILSCNGRGKSVNNTCRCEPIYSGSDCSINLLANAANELLDGENPSTKALGMGVRGKSGIAREAGK
jgi:hypothetical protein